MTFEELNDSTQWLPTDYINVLGDERNEEIFDTTGSAAEQLFPPFPKFGWHYAPYTKLITKEYRDLLLDVTDPTIVVDPIELDRAARDIVSLAFPFSTMDTLAFGIFKTTLTIHRYAKTLYVGDVLETMQLKIRSGTTMLKKEL